VCLARAEFAFAEEHPVKDYSLSEFFDISPVSGMSQSCCNLALSWNAVGSVFLFLKHMENHE